MKRKQRWLNPFGYVGAEVTRLKFNQTISLPLQPPYVGSYNFKSVSSVFIGG